MLGECMYVAMIVIHEVGQVLRLHQRYGLCTANFNWLHWRSLNSVDIMRLLSMWLDMDFELHFP